MFSERHRSMGTHRDVLDAFFPLSAPRARVCVGYTDDPSLTVPRVPFCELVHNWQATHAKTPRRLKGGRLNG